MMNDRKSSVIQGVQDQIENRFEEKMAITLHAVISSELSSIFNTIS